MSPLNTLDKVLAIIKEMPQHNITSVSLGMYAYDEKGIVIDLFKIERSLSKLAEDGYLSKSSHSVPNF